MAKQKNECKQVVLETDSNTSSTPDSLFVQVTPIPPETSSPTITTPIIIPNAFPMPENTPTIPVEQNESACPCVQGQLSATVETLYSGFDKKQIEMLSQPISPDRVLSREGPWNRKKHKYEELKYLPAYYIIDQANRIFGFDNWDFELKNLETRRIPEIRWDSETQTRKETECWFSKATVEITVYAGNRIITRTGIGHSKSEYDIELAEKGAESDAMKRAFRTFGAQFGNSLYDKDVLAELDKPSPNGDLPQQADASSAQQTAATPKFQKPGPASANQIRYIEKLMRSRNMTMTDLYELIDSKPDSLSQLSFKEASIIIGALQKEN